MLVASYSSSGCCNDEDVHLNRANDMVNEQVAFSEKVSLSTIPLVVESYEAWGKEAQHCFPRSVSCLAIHNCTVPRPCQRLNFMQG